MRKAKRAIKPLRGASDPRHGTPGGYGYWGCRCEKCREFARETARALRSKPLAAEKHGRSGYDQGCRCEKCATAKLIQGRELQEARRRWKQASGEVKSTRVELAKLL